MTWDGIQKEWQCPCGAGTFVATYWSDDWGKSDESREMNCERCRENYVFYKYHYFDERIGRGATLYRWVAKREKEVLDNLKKSLNEIHKTTSELSRNRYLTQWLAHFASKSKKSVWQELKADGHCHVPSIGTFYRHVKSTGIEGYLQWYFQEPERIEAIVSILDVTDPDVESGLAKIAELSAMWKKSEIEMVRNGVA
jgi:hypothetical protein